MRTRCIVLGRSLVLAAAVCLSGTSAFASGAAVSEDQLESSLGLTAGTLLDVGNGSAVQTSPSARRCRPTRRPSPPRGNTPWASGS